MTVTGILSLFKGIIKWIILVVVGILIIVLIIGSMKGESGGLKGHMVKSRRHLGSKERDRVVTKMKRKVMAKRLTGSVGNIAKLRDIFNLPDRRDVKFNSRFVLSAKNNGRDSSRHSGNVLPYFFNNIKIKEFSHDMMLHPSLIFTGGKVALIKIDGKPYYVHAGTNIKDIFIIKVGLSGISYSYKGKIKYLGFK
ncbi:hypothetical protein ACMCNP_05925 [Candidatus Acidulodesulfobacterium sp. H_13]|uniref:hypothetical protein n=1 Tax=Candidatus Acidulodesulfobacterium sp. H_13 TaxID=3395470 RepID=UPI003AF994C5